MTPDKILVIGPAWVGDMVMAQVLFKWIKQQNPNVMIDVLAPVWSQPLLERMPEVRRGLVMPWGHGTLQLKKRWQLGLSLRQENYHQAIVLPNSWKSALVPFAARIPIRTGWVGEFRYGLLNDVRVLNKKALPLMVQRFLALGLTAVETLPRQYAKPALRVSLESSQLALAKYQLNASAKPILALCPGAEFGPAKRWPEQYFAQVAQQKLRMGWQVWLFGSAKDQLVANAIMQTTHHACVDLTGKTTLAEAVDLLALAKLVVTNDSGLMHVAAALQRPLVVMYGSSSPIFTPPLSDQVKILSLHLACSPCFKRVCPLEHLKCLRDLAPHQVLQAMDELVSA